MSGRPQTTAHSHIKKPMLERNKDNDMLRNFFGREAGQASVEFLLIFAFVVMFLGGGLALLALGNPVSLR